MPQCRLELEWRISVRLKNRNNFSVKTFRQILCLVDLQGSGGITPEFGAFSLKG
jgi:hypothetical protein